MAFVGSCFIGHLFSDFIDCLVSRYIGDVVGEACPHEMIATYVCIDCVSRNVLLYVARKSRSFPAETRFSFLFVGFMALKKVNIETHVCLTKFGKVTFTFLGKVTAIQRKYQPLFFQQ